MCDFYPHEKIKPYSEWIQDILDGTVLTTDIMSTGSPENMLLYPGYPCWVQDMMDHIYQICRSNPSADNTMKRNKLLTRNFILSLIGIFNAYKHPSSRILIQDPTQSDLHLFSRIQSHHHKLSKGNQAYRLYNTTVGNYMKAPLETRKKLRKTMRNARKAIETACLLKKYIGCPDYHGWNDSRPSLKETGLGGFEAANKLADLYCRQVQDELNDMIDIKDMGNPDSEMSCMLEHTRREDFHEWLLLADDSSAESTSAFDSDDDGLLEEHSDEAENYVSVDLFDDRFWSSSGRFLGESADADEGPEKGEDPTAPNLDSMDMNTAISEPLISCNLPGNESEATNINKEKLHPSTSQSRTPKFISNEPPSQDKWMEMLTQTLPSNKAYTLIVALYLYKLSIERPEAPARGVSAAWDKRVLQAIEDVLAADERGVVVDTWNWDPKSKDQGYTDPHEHALKFIRTFITAMRADIDPFENTIVEFLESVVREARANLEERS